MSLRGAIGFTLAILLGFASEAVTAKKKSSIKFLDTWARIETQELDTTYKIQIPSVRVKRSREWMDFVNWFNNEGKQDFSTERFAMDFHRCAINFRGSLVTAPVVCQERTFIVTSKGRVEAYDCTSKKLVWSVPLCFSRGDMDPASALCKDGKLYLTLGHHLVVFSCLTGEELMYKTFKCPIRSAAVHKGAIFLHVEHNDMYILDANSGILVTVIPGSGKGIVVEGVVRPLVYKDLLLTNLAERHIVGLNMKQMKFDFTINFDKWRANQALSRSFSVIDFGELYMQPLLDEAKGFIYFCTEFGYLHKYDLEHRKHLWTVSTPGIQNLVQIGNALFLTTFSGQVAAINPENGKFIWLANCLKDDASNRAVSLLPPVCVNGGLLVISNKGRILRFSPQDGRKLAELNMGPITSYALFGGQFHLFGPKGSILTME